MRACYCESLAYKIVKTINVFETKTLAYDIIITYHFMFTYVNESFLCSLKNHVRNHQRDIKKGMTDTYNTYCVVKLLTLVVTPLKNQFSKRAYKISHPPRLLT